MTRKEFVRLMGASAASLIVLNELSCSKTDVIPRVDFTLDLADPIYFDLTLTGGFMYFDNVIVFKGLDQNYYALSKICTHQGCTVEYNVGYNEVICPCHGSQYDIHGNVLMGPAFDPLFEYETTYSGTLLRVFSL